VPAEEAMPGQFETDDKTANSKVLAAKQKSQGTGAVGAILTIRTLHGQRPTEK
jgi:hypothetical protein